MDNSLDGFIEYSLYDSMEVMEPLIKVTVLEPCVGKLDDVVATKCLPVRRNLVRPWMDFFKNKRLNDDLAYITKGVSRLSNSTS
jgi:hypothetical protein